MLICSVQTQSSNVSVSTVSGITQTNVFWNLISGLQYDMNNGLSLDLEIWGGIPLASASTVINITFDNQANSEKVYFAQFTGFISGNTTNANSFVDAQHYSQGYGTTGETGITPITNEALYELEIGAIDGYQSSNYQFLSPNNNYTALSGTSSTGYQSSSFAYKISVAYETAGFEELFEYGNSGFWLGKIVTFKPTDLSFNFMNSLNYNFIETLSTTQYSQNQTFQNITTWNWLELNSSLYNHTYAFKFECDISVLYINTNTPKYFSFYSNDNYSNAFGFTFGAFSATYFQVNIFLENKYTNTFFVPYSPTINFSDSYKFEFLFLSNYTVGQSSEILTVYRQSDNATMGYTNLAYVYTPLFDVNDQLSLNITGINSNSTLESIYYENLIIANVILYSVNLNPNYTSFDGFLMTIPTNEVNEFSIVFYPSPNLNTTSNGTFYLGYSPQYFSLGANDLYAETFLNASLNYVYSSRIITNSCLNITLGLRVTQPNTAYMMVKIWVTLFEDVGDYPNFTFSNVVEKTSYQEYCFKWTGIGTIETEPTAIVMSPTFFLFLILMFIPFLICIFIFWKRLKIYSVVMGASVSFAVGLFNPSFVPIWILFIIGGCIVFFVYYKISQKSGNKV